MTGHDEKQTLLGPRSKRDQDLELGVLVLAPSQRTSSRPDIVLRLIKSASVLMAVALLTYTFLPITVHHNRGDHCHLDRERDACSMSPMILTTPGTRSEPVSVRMTGANSLQLDFGANEYYLWVPKTANKVVFQFKAQTANWALDMGSPHSVVVDAELSRLGAVTVNDVDVETMAKLQHTCSTGSTAGLVGTLTVRQLMNEKHGSSTSPSDSVPQPRPDVVIDDGVPSLNLIKFALICDRSDDAGITTPVAVSSVSSVSPCETLAKPISKPIVKRQAGRSLVRRGWSGRSHTGKNHNRQQSAPRSK